MKVSLRKKGMACWSQGLVFMVFVMTAANAMSATYPDLPYTGPSPMPDISHLPAFDPPVHSDPVASGAPAISEWTRFNQPGHTMALSGESLGSEFVFYSENASKSGTVRFLKDRKAAVTLPRELKFNDVYLLWNQNDHGFSEPVAINAADAWWIGPEYVEEGKPFSVYGRNLQLGSTSTYLYIEETGQWMTNHAGNPYKADFIADLAPGDYTIWAHNGKGSEYGWSDSLSLTVRSAAAWDENKSNWIDVTKSPYNADNTGATDCRQDLLDAINDADDIPWSTVYLPEGTYILDGELSPGSITQVRIIGDGMEKTFIEQRDDGSLGSSDAVLDVGLQYGELADLTLRNGTGVTNYAHRIFDINRCYYSTFRGVRFSQRYPEVRLSTWGSNGAPSQSHASDIVEPGDAHDLQWIDCEFILRKPVRFDNDNDNQRFDGCDFYGCDAVNTILPIKGSKHISIENCTAQNLGDNTNPDNFYEWSNGRFAYSYPKDRGESPRYWYFGNNSVNDLTQSHKAPYQNTGEDFMFEKCEVVFIDEPVDVTPDTVVFDELNTIARDMVKGREIEIVYVGCTLSVVDGKGFAQSRIITDVDFNTDTLTLDKPWRVLPDRNSRLAVSFSANSIVAYNNSFDGIPYPGEDLDKTAESGVQSYGGCVNFIADSNRSHEQEACLYVYSNTRALASISTNQSTPNYFNVYQNNIADTCYHLGRVMVAVPHDYDHLPTEEYGAMFGNVFRDNYATNISAAVWNLEWNMDYPHHQMSIYEGTVADDYNDDVNFFNKPRGPGSDNAPEAIAEQVVVDEYVNDSWPVPPPDPPPAPVLTGITVSGPSTVAEGDSAQYTCTASYSDGSTALVLPTWSEDSADASINSSGVLSARDVEADEQVTVTASYGGYTDTHDITILFVPPFVTGIEIAGPSSMDEETTAEYTCTATYSDGTTVAVPADWNDNSAYASINSAGVLTAGNVTADKDVVITAGFDGQTDAHAVTIRYVPPALTGISISGSSSLAEGSAAQYTCTASYSDGTSAEVTPTWSEDSAYAAISSAGLLSAGNVTADQDVAITAAFGGLTDTYAVTITYVAPVLTGITVSGPAAVDEGSTAQYTCTAHYSDGSSSAVTPTWTENSAYASISSAGLLTARDVTADQGVTVTATFGGMSDTHAVTVAYIAPTVTGITVSGPAEVEEGATAQFNCTASYSDGTSAVVTPVWTENSVNATITGAGLLNAGDVTADQDLTVTASFEGKTDTHAVTILYVAPTLTGITISGPSSVDEGGDAQYTCTAEYSDGTSEVVTPDSWTENSAYATISSSGRLNVGDVTSNQGITVSASFEGESDTYAVSIVYIPPTVTSITISGPQQIEENVTAQYACTANYSDGSSSQINPVWSENSAAASIDNAGLLSVGNVDADESITIQANFEGRTATLALTVMSVGDQIVFQLSGFEGKTVSAELWDDVAQSMTDLGEEYEPEEIVIENVNPDQWYWLGLREYDSDTDEWVLVQGRWIWK